MKTVLSIILIPFLGYDATEVITPLGAIRGYLKTSHKGRKYSAFEGIPYAKPPIGERRFEPPESAEPWYGTWDANCVSECAQINVLLHDSISGDEDCLHINVYVPRKKPNSSESLDVFTHIHGGGFMTGSGHFYASPQMIMDREIIFVTFNFRLGILGFLSTEDDVLPGNLGLKDQVLALKWIQKNIASFGGNPGSVTLTGHSTGAASVHLHYFSEMSKGLFHRGIVQSAVALGPWLIQKKALHKTKNLGRKLGCPVENNRGLVNCLKQRTFRQILGEIDTFFYYKMLPLVPLAPVVESSKEPFLSKQPYDLLTNGKVQDLPLIISNVLHDGYFPHLVTPEEIEQYNQNFDSIMAIALVLNENLDQTSQAFALKTIKDFYLGGRNLTEDDVISMLGNRYFFVSCETAAKMHAKVARSPVYVYYFAYQDNKTESTYIGHGNDVRYYFGPSLYDPRPFSSNQVKMNNIFLDIFVSYAKTGIPTINGVQWKPTSHDKLTYLYIDSFVPEEISLKTVDELAPIKFWSFLENISNNKLKTDKDEL